MPVAIDKPSKYFNTVLYTGTGANQTITVGFQPDWVWTKSRSLSYSNEIQDSVRGSTKVNYSDNVNAEDTTSTNIQSFNSTGYVQGSGTGVNGNGATFVSWNWLASNTTASNTSGTISSTVSANTTSGFSIVSYTGDGVNNRTVGHGLGATPKFIIIKNRSAGTAFWSVINPRSTSTSDTNILYLNRTDAEADDTNIMGTNLPNSTTFGIGNYAGVNVNAQNFIAYCFAEVKGFSKFSSYVGNGSTDGTFVYTGFKPAWIMVKETSNVNSWRILDNKRDTFNVATKPLYANLSTAEGTTSHNTDFLSNGFKLRDSDTSMNRSGGTFIYMAFAENPFVSSKGIPCTAR